MRTEILHVLIRPESDGERVWYVAQCLERDIAAQAETLKDLEHEFQRVVAGRIAIGMELEIDPFESLPPAPQEFWDLWEDARRVEDPIMRSFRRKQGNLPEPWMMTPVWKARVA